MSEHLKAENVKRSLAYIQDFHDSLALENIPPTVLEKKEKAVAAMAHLESVFSEDDTVQPEDTCSVCGVQTKDQKGSGHDASNPAH